MSSLLTKCSIVRIASLARPSNLTCSLPIHARGVAKFSKDAPPHVKLIEELHNPHFKNFAGPHLKVFNKATHEEVGHVPDMDHNHAREAIEKAHKAFHAWRHVTAKERAALLMKWHDLIMQNKEYLAQLMTSEQGKTLTESRGEVGYGASFISWYAEEGKRVYGDLMPAANSSQRIVVMKQPVGVCGLITPWNFPLAMITRKAGAALAAGCTTVIKPAEDTPLTAQALVSLGWQAGIPRDALALITSSRNHADSIGNEFTSHPFVRKISFTGSTPVGKHLASKAAANMKRFSMELGGNAPFIVFEDANIDAAVAGALAAKFRNSGQTCVCANRLFVHEKVYDEFMAKMLKGIGQFTVGHGLSAETTHGPLINRRAVEKVTSMLDDAKNKGARVLCGGKPLGGNFFDITLVANVTPDMEIYKSEIFGPIAPVVKFQSEEEVLKMANNTWAGLAGYFFSNDITRVWKVAEALEFGIVGVNTGITSSEVAPFGGVKDSGVGREGSKYGIMDYLDIKYVLMQLKP